jgi:hypothetical protein
MLLEQAARLKAQADWLDRTIIEIIIQRGAERGRRLQEVGMRLVSDQIVWERINFGTGSGVILTDVTEVKHVSSRG